MAWAQIEVENNRVRRLQCRHRGWHANIRFAGPAAEPVCEVIPLCSKFALESNANYWLRSSKKSKTHAEPPGLLHRGEAGIASKSPGGPHKIELLRWMTQPRR